MWDQGLYSSMLPIKPRETGSVAVRHVDTTVINGTLITDYQNNSIGDTHDRSTSW